jgi:hypothetical protein
MDTLDILGIATILGWGWVLLVEAVGPVVDRALRDPVAHITISVVVEDGAHWTVDWKLEERSQPKAALS